MSGLGALPNALLFAAIGVLAFVGVAALFFRGAGRALWQRATEGSDVASAVVVASVLLALASIIAAAVH